MKKYITLGLMGLLSQAVHAQQEIKLTISYNDTYKVYQVFAKPNFSQRNFLWGPSQISVVFPEKIADKTLAVKNTDGGVWDDNSRVFSPKVQGDCDFHAFSTAGAKTDLVENFPSLLFEFSVDDKEIAGVRLFENQKDPSSDKEGMKGGDFRNSIVGINGQDIYQGNYSVEQLSTVELEKEQSSAIEVFPNPNQGQYQMKIGGFKGMENIELSFFTSTGVLISKETKSREQLAKPNNAIPSLTKAQMIFVRAFDEKGVAHSKKIFVEM
jgi:hypothetical protein